MLNRRYTSHALCSGRRQHANYDHLTVSWLCRLPGGRRRVGDIRVWNDLSKLIELHATFSGFKRDFKTFLYSLSILGSRTHGCVSIYLNLCVKRIETILYVIQEYKNIQECEIIITILSGFHDIPQNLSVGFTDVIN